MDKAEGAFMSDKAWCMLAGSSDFLDAILNPLNKRMTPKGEPAAKKLSTGNKSGGNLLFSLVEGRGSSTISVGTVGGCKLSISNASRD